MTVRAQGLPWRSGDFRLLVAGQTVTQLGTDVTTIAFPLIAVLLLHATPWQLGVLVAVQNGAFLLLGVPAGVWLDRRRLRPVLITTDLVRCAALVAVTVTAALGRLTLPLLVAAAAVMAAMRVLFDIGHQSYLPRLLHRADLLRGNCTLETVRSSGQVAGPSLGGWLTHLVGATNTLLVDAVSFLISAACLARIRAREPAPRPAARTGTAHEAREGLSFVLRDPVLRAIAATSALVNLLFTAATALIVLFLIDTVGVSPAAAGVLLSAAPAAALLGAVTAGRLARRVGLTRTIWLSAAVSSPFNLLVPLTGRGWGLAFFVVGLLGSGAGQVVYGIAQTTYRQATVPARLQCRVNATMRFLVMGALPLGGLLGGALGELVGIRSTLLLIGAGLALAPVPLLLSPLRRGRDLAAPRDPADPPLRVGMAPRASGGRRAGPAASRSGTTCRARRVTGRCPGTTGSGARGSTGPGWSPHPRRPLTRREGVRRDPGDRRP
ncbi:MFS transporter [Micromonospora terminaliae]|uniref:MFS transporter n=1 Tax=Micromonospora terminaliae TaxID=1914461 RepID=A0AAJ3DIU2_9ACTN|nr:MFS transporter [Micromonospora terminaliae]NES27781.1 MFS transporter [Micromonospora terminaliae]QGL47436.1 MFS transporter [Micromonospora terminaliae]